MGLRVRSKADTPLLGEPLGQQPRVRDCRVGGIRQAGRDRGLLQRGVIAQRVERSRMDTQLDDRIGIQNAAALRLAEVDLEATLYEQTLAYNFYSANTPS
jgi:hypothetical protein